MVISAKRWREYRYRRARVYIREGHTVENKLDQRSEGSKRGSYNSLGQCVPGKSMLEAAKKRVLQEWSKPRRESEETESETESER